MATKNEIGFAIELRLRGKEAPEIAARMLPAIAKDRDWPLITGKKKPTLSEEYVRAERALTRVTKKATAIMYPKHAISVQRGAGTAHDWVHIDITMPELVPKKVRGTTQEWEYKNVCRRIEDVLVALGIKYARRYTDFGRRNFYAPCLSVTVNRMG